MLGDGRQFAESPTDSPVPGWHGGAPVPRAADGRPQRCSSRGPDFVGMHFAEIRSLLAWSGNIPPRRQGLAPPDRPKAGIRSVCT